MRFVDPNCVVKLFPPTSTDRKLVATPRYYRVDNIRNYPAMARIVLDYKWDEFKDEQDENNCAQQRSYVEIWDGLKCVFRGLVRYVQRERVNGEPVVVLTCRCKSDVLNDLPVGYDDGSTIHYIFMRQTPVLEITNTTLYPISATPPTSLPEELRYAYYPDTTSSAWLPDTVGPSTTLGQVVTAVSPATGGRLKLSQTNPKMPPVGFVTINGGSEFVFYNGLALDEADSFYYANQIVRGALGTTPGTGAINDTVNYRSPKRIDMETPRYLEGNAGGTWDLIRGPFTTQDEDGSFLFPDDPLKYRGGSSDYSALRAQTYGVFDEDNASRLTLHGLIQDVLEIVNESLGPGWVTGSEDTCRPNISITPEIVLTRVVVDRPTYIMEFIRGLLNDLQLVNGSANDALAFWYDPHEDEFVLRSIDQAATPDISYRRASRVLQDDSVDEVFSAVMGTFGSLLDQSLIDESRVWHEPADNDPNFPRCYQLLNGEWFYRGASTDLLIPQPFRMTRNTGEDGTDKYPKNTITDRLNNTGWALAWDTEPSPGTYLYAWFPEVSSTNPKLFFINRVRAVFEAVGYTDVGTSARFGVKIVGYDSFTGSLTSTPPTTGSPRNLSPKLAVQFSPGQLNFPDFTLEDEGLFVPAKAVGVYVTGFLQDADKSDWYTIKLKELYVSATPLNVVLAKIVAAYSSTDVATSTAPETEGKLRPAKMRQHKVGIFDFGDTTRNAALYLSWLQLIMSHGLSQTRKYVTDNQDVTSLGTPDMCQTIGFEEGYSGVLDEYSLEYTSGVRTLEMRVINFDTPVYGS